MRRISMVLEIFKVKLRAINGKVFMERFSEKIPLQLLDIQIFGNQIELDYN